MEKLKIHFTDFWPGFEEDENIFLPILQKYFDIEISANNPDVVIHSIYKGFKETPKYNCKKILFLGENFRPEQFKSDYSISFDPHTNINYRLPLWQYYLILKPELKDILFGPRINHESFDRNAAFVVSNPSNGVRNAFFDKMSFSSWFQIFSYGRYKTNNYELIEASKGRYWRDAKYEFFQKYKHKYIIAFENTAYPYYCTEKLMDAFLAGSLPLYWGGPKVSEDWNKEAFINVGVRGLNESYELIHEMERDNKLFLEMYEKPIFTEEQRQNHMYNIKGFEDWFIKIIKN